MAVCATAHNQERFVFITTSTHDLSCLVMSNWLKTRLWWNTSFWLARSVEFTGVWKSTNSRSGVASSFGKEPHQAQSFCKKLVNPSYGKCLFDWKLYIFEEQIIYSVCPGCYSIEVQVDQTWKGCHLGHSWKNTGKCTLGNWTKANPRVQRTKLNKKNYTNRLPLFSPWVHPGYEFFVQCKRSCVKGKTVDKS